MSTLSIRIPDSLHGMARKLAEQEDISLNQLISLALAEKISALATEDYLNERAKRADRKAFKKALSKIPKGKPDPSDAL